MKRASRFVLRLLVVTTAALLTPPTSAQLGQQTIGGYVKVSELRVTRTVTEYVYRAMLTNTGPALAGAAATVSSLSAATMIVDGSVGFGPVGPGETVTSLDTFTFRHDRTIPFEFSVFNWSIVPAAGNTPPVANAGPDRTFPIGTLVTLNGSGSSDADGDALSYRWQFASRPAGSSAVLQNPTSVTSTFTIDVEGNYVVRLIVNDGTVDSAPDLVTISTQNSAPVANAGPDQTVAPGSTVTLDGSASSDVDGQPLTFSWALVQRPAGSAATLSNPSAVTPTFFTDTPGTYRARLIVNDGFLNSEPDFVEIQTLNSPPVANAGPDQTVAPASSVTLNGSGSTDADGNPLTYTWSLTTRPAGSTATLSNPNAVMPTFFADRPGTYVAQLVVNDGFTSSAPDTVMITTVNAAPVANAGPDQTVIAGQVVFLDGSGSSDADGNPLTFAWSLISRPAGSTATLTGVTTAFPSFAADRPGTYVAQLIVNDGFVDSAPDTVTISTTNSTPVADAGPDQLSVAMGSLVTLNGSGSSDADGHALTFQWSLLSRPAGSTATLTSPAAVSPTFTADVAGDYVAQLMVNDGFVNSAPDTVLVRAAAIPLPVITIDAIDSNASEVGTDPGVVRFTRTGSTTSPLAVSFTISGTAVNGVDYESITSPIVIPAGQASVNLTIAPKIDTTRELNETAIITVTDDANLDVGSPTTAMVVIVDIDGDCGLDVGGLVNGATHCGTIAGAGEADTWTFSATAGDRIGVHIGEVSDDNDFRPWIRVMSPTAVPLASSAGVAAAEAGDVIAPATGTYTVLVSSFDSGFDGTGTYRIVMTHTPGPITVSAGDQGGALTNGGLHIGAIYPGDLDVWTFTAPAGDRIGVHIGEIVDTDDFRPWIRLWAPNGATLGSSSGTDAAEIGDVIAPVTGTYLVLVASFDSGFDGSGTYRLTMTHTPGPITVSGDDQGGPLTNGGLHTGEILQGDLDVWTFTAPAGDRIGVHIGEIVDTDDFRPWIRLWAPNGATLGSSSGTDAAEIGDVIAPVTGTYLVLVASFDSGFDGSGTYRLTMTHTPGPITVSGDDQGGPLTNGGLHTGEILQGDLDVWTFTAPAGDRIGVHIGEIVDTDDFRPWIRLWTPNGATLGSSSGTDAAEIGDVIAPVTGTYLVLVASFDSGFDGSGTYRLTMTHTPGPITVSGDDQGGPLTNGGLHTGEILQGDLDVWTFTAPAGDRIGVHIGEIVDTDDFRPWIRLWTPNGATLGSSSGTDAAEIGDVIAPVTGTYLVLVASFDSGFDGSGTYRLTMTHTPGPITVSGDDQGGPLTNGGLHTGEILQGDLDVWTFTAPAGDRIGVHIGEIVDTDDFRPWIRLWTPNGATLGSSSGTDAAQIGDVIAPVTGTYLVLVASFDSGFDGSGTYRLTMTHTPGPITVSGDDQGGPLTNGGLHTGEILQGDLDVWTFTAPAGDRIGVHLGEIVDTDDFRPWIRLWAPNGATLGSSSGTDAAQIGDVIAPVTGTYLVLVASFDSGFDGSGTYRLTMTHTPGPITVSGDDQGGPLTNGGLHTGEILQGDLDVWTFTATAGDVILVQINETSETDDFRPWIRLWAPNGATLGNTAGLATATIGPVVAPVTGTYTLLVASFDSGVDGTGTYALTATR